MRKVGAAGRNRTAVVRKSGDQQKNKQCRVGFGRGSVGVAWVARLAGREWNGQEPGSNYVIVTLVDYTS